MATQPVSDEELLESFKRDIERYLLLFAERFGPSQDGAALLAYLFEVINRVASDLCNQQQANARCTNATLTPRHSQEAIATNTQPHFHATPPLVVPQLQRLPLSLPNIN